MTTLEKASSSMKSEKTAAPDEVPAELLKLGEGTVIKAMHKITEGLWKTGKWPEDWTQSTFVPIYKKYVPTITRYL